MILIGIVKHFQSSQNSKFAMPLQYLKKKVRDEVDFLHADKHQSFLQVDFNTLGIKVSYKVILPLLMGIIKHCQSTQSNNLKYLYNISKKEVRNGVSFACRWTSHTYQVSHIVRKTHASALFITLTRIINTISGMSCGVTFRVNINSKI